MNNKKNIKIKKNDYSSGKNNNIKSTDNPKFKYWKELLNPQKFKKNTEFIISGKKIINEIINSLLKINKNFTSYGINNNKNNSSILMDYIDISCIILPEKNNFLQDKENLFHILLSKLPLKYFLLSSNLFKELDSLNTRHPLIIAKKPCLEKWDPQKPPKGLEILCPLGDPKNLGSIIRSAKAFNISKVILLKEACYPFHPKVIKSSAGNIFSQKILLGPSIKEVNNTDNNNNNNNNNTNIIDIIDDKIYALSPRGQNINQFCWPKNLRLIIGEEGPGLHNEKHYKKISIPINSEVESLNASVAASIVFFLYNQKFSNK